MTTRMDGRRRASVTGAAALVTAAAVLGVRAPAAAAEEATWLAPVSGYWIDRSKWSTDPVFPNDLATDVAISAAGAPYTVTLASDASAGLLTLGSPDATLNLTERSLTLGRGLHLDGGLFLATAPDIFSAARGLRGTLPITGTGQVIARGAPLNVHALDASLAIAAGVTLRAEQGGKLTLRSLGADGLPRPFATAGSIVADGAGTSAALVGPLNTGTLRALDGGTLSITALGGGGGGPVNAGTIELAGTKSKLLFSSAEPIRRSTLGSIVRSPENAALPNVVISARIDNAGSTISADSFGGRWAFDPAAKPSAVGIVGGTIVPGADPDAELAVRGCLDGVTIDGKVHAAGSDDPYQSYNETLSLPQGLIINDTLRLSGAMRVLLGDGTGSPVTFSGTGQITFDRDASGRTPRIEGPLVVAPGFTVRTGTGGAEFDPGYAGTTRNTNVNRGTILADTPGTAFHFDYHNEGLVEAKHGGDAGFVAVNKGTVRASDGGGVAVHFPSNGGTVTVTSGARLTLAGIGSPPLAGAPDNPGTISVTDSTVIFTGSGYDFDDLPALTLAGNSNVRFGGVFLNIGKVLDPRSTPYGPLRHEPGFEIFWGTLGTHGDPEWAPDPGLRLHLVDVRVPIRATGALEFSGTQLNAPVHTTGALVFGSGGGWVANAPVVVSGPAASLSGLKGTETDDVLSKFTVEDGATLNVTGLRTAQLSTMNLDRAVLAIGSEPLSIQDYELDNTGATFTVPTYRGNVVVLGDNARIRGGILTGDGPGVTFATRPISNLTSPVVTSDVRFLGVTLRDLHFQVGPGYSLGIGNGLILDNARVSLCGDSWYTNASLGFSTSLSGTGEVVFDTTASYMFDANEIRANASPDNPITVGSGITIRTGAGSGIILCHSSEGGTLNNQGTLSAETNGRLIEVKSPLTVDNQGVIRAANGGRLFLHKAPKNYSATTRTLSGGTWQVFAGSQLHITDTAPIRIEVNAADVTLSGPGSLFPTFDFLATNAGTFTLTDGRHFATVGDLANTGTLRVGPGSVLTVRGALANGGTIDLDGGLIVEDPPAGGPSGAAGVWTSSAVAADPSGLTVLASLVNDDGSGRPLFGSLDGQPAPLGSLLVRCTLRGDANLDGRLDAADYYLVDRGYAMRTAGWASGDFDRSGGAATVEDYLLIDSAFLRRATGAASGPAAGTASGAPRPVPEPAAAALLLPVVGLLLRRRARRPVK